MKLRGLVSSLVLGVLVPIGSDAGAQEALWVPEEPGLGVAIYEQGLKYLLGIGVASDPAEALRLMYAAAEAGSAEAQAYLGNHHAALSGQEHSAALNDALESGDVDALPVRRIDWSEAAKWYRLAAARGHQQSQFELAQLLSDPDGNLYSAEAASEALELYRQGAEAGSREAQFELGKTYLEGEAVAANERLGIDWLERSAEQGFAKAQVELGNYYFDQAQKPNSGKKAVEWARRAAQSDDIDSSDLSRAYFLLGKIYAAGRGVPQSDAEAEKWFSVYAASDEILYPDSFWRIGVKYQQGIEVPKDLAIAAKWYERGAQRGSTKAQSALGLMLGLGEGAAQDNAQAYFWLLLAASQRPDLAETRDSLRALLSPQEIAQVQADAARWTPTMRAPEPETP